MSEEQGLEAIGMADLAAVKDVPINESLMISTVALNMALRWYDMGIIKDGVLYQQKKMEGANIKLIDLPEVLATAQMFEAHLLAGPNRHAEMMSERIVDKFVHIMGDIVIDGMGRLADKLDDEEVDRHDRD